MAFELVVVGTSRGGLKALQTMLSGLHYEFSLPVVVVQHRSKEMETGLCQFVASHCALPVCEPDDKQPIEGGRVYLAPRDYHLMIEDGAFALSTDSPVAFARPSIDVLFESAADEYRERVVGVILTGQNRDGARGLAAIKARGGMTIVQEPDSAESKEMPRAAIATTQVNWILSLEEIAPRLNQLSKSNALQYGS